MIPRGRGTVTYRDSHQEKGADYSESFDSIPRRSVIWSLEKRILPRILNRHLRARSIRYLDFATGTGRILAELEPRVATATGVDVSPSMLRDARRRVRTAKLIRADLTETDVLDRQEFDLITAFRFFPNAEPELREEVMGLLVDHLADDGLLVFNNHHNPGSLAKRINHLRGFREQRQWQPEEIERLLEENGEEVVSRHGLGLLPFTERHMPVPAAVVRPVEAALARIPGSYRIASNVIYAARKTRRATARARRARRRPWAAPIRARLRAPLPLDGGAGRFGRKWQPFTHGSTGPARRALSGVTDAGRDAGEGTRTP